MSQRRLIEFLPPHNKVTPSGVVYEIRGVRFDGNSAERIEACLLGPYKRFDMVCFGIVDAIKTINEAVAAGCELGLAR